MMIEKNDTRDTDQEARLGELLRLHAPAARDPFFRINVLARRERQRYRTRVIQLLIGVALTVLAFALPALMGVDAGLLSAWLAGMASLLLAAFAYLPVWSRLMHFLSSKGAT